MFSKKTEDQLSAINIAEKVLYEVKQTYSNSNNIPSELPSYPKDSIGQYIEVNNQKYYLSFSVSQSAEEARLRLYRVHVEITDKNSRLLSEIYDYINTGG